MTIVQRWFKANELLHVAFVSVLVIYALYLVLILWFLVLDSAPASNMTISVRGSARPPQIIAWPAGWAGFQASWRPVKKVWAFGGWFGIARNPSPTDHGSIFWSSLTPTCLFYIIFSVFVLYFVNFSLKKYTS